MKPSQTPERQIQRLRSQIGWVTQISTALIATDNVDDVFSIVLSGLVAPTGLGYSQVLLFEYDSGLEQLRGRLALYHESQAAFEEIERELAEEVHYMEEKREEMERATNVEERLRAEADYQALTSGSEWATLFQRLNPDNDLSRQLERLSFSTRPANGRIGAGSIFEEMPFWRHPRALSKQALGPRLPAGLGTLLPEHFAIAPIYTKKGLRAIVVCDKRLAADPMPGKDEIVELAWFARQCALALENVELIADLALTYNELKQLDQLKTNFLSIISHELRTPLTSITGFVDLILEGRVGDINEHQKTLLGRVAKNSAHLNHLVSDLLEVAEIEAEGTLDVRVAPIDPLSILLDTLPKLEQRRRDQNVKVVPVFSGAVPHILADERALGRIFFHLIDNAMKFSPRNGEVEVRLRVEEGLFYADVCDRGPGIPKDKIPHIFKQFYQIDNTLTRGHEGLGLGLAITKMLVQASHGQIYVDSEPGVGSVFTVSFSVAE